MEALGGRPWIKRTVEVKENQDALGTKRLKREGLVYS